MSGALSKNFMPELSIFSEMPLTFPKAQNKL